MKRRQRRGGALSLATYKVLKYRLHLWCHLYICATHLCLPLHYGAEISRQ